MNVANPAVSMDLMVISITVGSRVMISLAASMSPSVIAFQLIVNQ
jgi:hypothetical protein